MQPLLTIAVPTYNRDTFLAPLISELISEVSVLGQNSESENCEVQILVTNNGSTDSTKAVCDNAKDIKYFTVAHQSQNLGSTENIRFCFSNSSGRYLWILGDDDRPRRGLVGSLLTSLRDRSPSMVFLRPEFFSTLPNIRDRKSFAMTALSKETFFKEVGVFTTFLSSVVFDTHVLQPAKVKSELLGLPELDIENLPHLAWVFPVLRFGSLFLASDDPVIECTSGNTGGYDVIRTFGAGFPSAVSKYFGDGKEGRLLVHELYNSYLPSLIWQVRFGDMRSSFPGQEIWWQECDSHNKTSRQFRLFGKYIATGSPLAARFARIGCSAFARLDERIEQLRFRNSEQSRTLIDSTPEN
jgi:abequosyltransferase